ncbi:MAG: hypothetical protein JO145_01870 [Acidobacteriaceae bacterium]|nr:hypothetical protein [Acidobacteriaceae bacterium]
MATKLQWAEVFQSYEALAQGLVAQHEQLELQRQADQRLTGLFTFIHQALGWFAANP